MREQISAELAADAAAFASALPASVEMPAGAGKTHLLSATARHIVEGGGRMLVLTHTNAGVYAVNARLKRFGITRGVQVSTITSFAFRLARAYPDLGQLQVPKVTVPRTRRPTSRPPPGSPRGSTSRPCWLRRSRTCSSMSTRTATRPTTSSCPASAWPVPATGVFGVPLQAIFGFNDRLADWAAVVADYPPHPTTIKPWRWSGHNDALGYWLLAIRPLMVPGHVVNWTSIALPAGVTFQNIAGNRQGVTQAAFATYPASETVVIIAAWPNTARTIAGNLNGTFAVMEEVAGKFMAQSIGGLVAADPAAYALWLFDLTKSCHCGHGVLDTGTLRNRYANSRTASDLLGGGSGSRAGAEPAIGAFDVVVSNPTLSNLAAPMDVIPTSSAPRLHSHEAWYDVQTSIRGAVAQANDTGVLLDEIAKTRDVLRYAGRRERKRLISRTLLVKGLEYDHVIIADVGDHAKVDDLYVVLSRARKSITILVRSNTLQLQPSPNGR